MRDRMRRLVAASERESIDMGIQRINTETAAKCVRIRGCEADAFEAAWADLRQAVARGEITREELLTGYAAEPVRLMVGNTSLEVAVTTTVCVVPARSNTVKHEVLPFKGASRKVTE